MTVVKRQLQEQGRALALVGFVRAEEVSGGETEKAKRVNYEMSDSGKLHSTGVVSSAKQLPQIRRGICLCPPHL